MAEAALQATEEFPLQFTIARSTLLSALGKLQSVVEKRNTIPILANIKLQANAGQLQLTATDMDIVATENVAANVSQEGALTVPAQTLYDIVRKLNDDADITLSTDVGSNQVVVESGKARFSLSYLPAADFPVMSEGELTHNFAINAGTLLQLIDRARFAMSTEETRYYLNGVYLHQEQNDAGAILRAVATDGHRLARIETALPSGAENMPGVIVPRKTVGELKKLFEGESGDIAVSLSESKIRFTAGNTVILSKLVDGTFPDYARVIPESNTKTMAADTKTLTHAVDLVSTISSEKTRGIKFLVQSGQLTLSAQSPDAGTAKEELDVEYGSDEISIGFNSRYVLEMMSQLTSDAVQFVFNDSNSPALVSDPEDSSALYVIMPMRV